jgi:hypothetical protein
MSLNGIDSERLPAVIHEGLSSDLEAPWRVPPLFEPDRWTVLDPPRAAAMIEALARSLAKDKKWLNCEPMTRVRMVSLAFYPGATLYEAETRTFEGVDGLVLFIGTAEGCTLLDGTSQPIHGLNLGGLIDLGDPEKALQYVRFFCAAVDGDAGPFTIVDSVADLERDVTGEKEYWLSGLSIAPPSTPVLSADGEHWSLSACVNYGGSLTRSEFTVQTSGMIRMDEESPELEGSFPFRIYAFWGNVRQDRTAACNPEAA